MYIMKKDNKPDYAEMTKQKYHFLCNSNVKPQPRYDVLCDIKYFSRQIPLPQMEDYPVEDFSSFGKSFYDLSKKHPQFIEQFELLRKVKQLQNENFKVISMCISGNLNTNQKYIHLVFSCKGKFFESAQGKLKKIGL